MKKMPVLFVGHGSPMNAIEENQFSLKWKELGETIERPKAIVSISAHWFTSRQRVMNNVNPKTIHDMYGFPEELYKLEYPADGAVNLAVRIQQLLGEECILDSSWGIDHGTWSVLHWMYADADIPVLQVSVDGNASASDYIETGKLLNNLRHEGVLIFGSGNVVHNLGRVDWEQEKGFPWADEFDDYIKNAIIQKNFRDVVEYRKAGKSADLAVPTMDHFAPLLYCLGAVEEDDTVQVFNNERVLGSMSMTGYLFQ